ncbi:SAMH1-like protein [Mya arenaria]|uniref:SAMH1-like protein n=1 Tax=Mya arenaria TaxID=6604 RepID=A0ABY7ESD3_MYAAR|nr:SAMH1-like protein [Mya arenaria]
MFIPAVLPGSKWKHEQASTEMFDYLVAENKLLPEFDKYGLTELDRVFIKEQIDRPSEPEIAGSSTPDQKEVGNLYDMFHTRRTLHSRAYQHKTTKIIEKMKKLKMSESIHDMKAFSQMTDHVFNLIVSSTDTDLNESREILKKVLRRELYKFVGQIQMLKELVTLDYGMKDKNPIGSVRFYSKDEPNKAGPIRQDQKPSFIPDHFTEQQTRIYSKELDTGFLKVVREVLNSLSDKTTESGDKNSPDEKDKSTKSSNDTEGGYDLHSPSPDEGYM